MKPLIQVVAVSALWVFAAGVAAVELDANVAAIEAAAEQGGPRAQIELAARYEHAEGVPRDFQKANQLYCQAARQGYAEAQFKLGWVYANARGVPRDEGVAAALFGMAAAQGHEYATKLLPYVRKQLDTQLPECLLAHPPLLPVPKPVRIVLEEPSAAPTNRSEIGQLVHRLAPQYAVDSQLAMAVISVESAFNPAAVSPKNARGLMQLIPATAQRFGVKEVHNPAENIKGGLAYLRWLLAFFQGDVSLVVAAYNAGERSVEKYRGIPPYSETRNYVRKITGIYKKTIHPYQADIVEPSPMMGRMKRPES